MDLEKAKLNPAAVFKTPQEIVSQESQSPRMQRHCQCSGVRGQCALVESIRVDKGKSIRIPRITALRQRVAP